MHKSAANQTYPIEDFLEGADDKYGDEFFGSDDFELREQIYDGHYWHTHRHEVIREELERAGLGRGDRLVEVGCGTGNVATHLNRSGFVVDYADIHSSALRIARRQAEEVLGKEQAGERRFMRLDITKQPLPEDYSALLLLDVLEHLPDDVGTLQSAAQALRPGSLVIFTVPAFQLLWSPWDDIHCHKRRYTKAQALELARRANLQEPKALYFFFPLFFAALGVKALRTAVNLVKPPTTEQTFDTMLESKPNPAINRVMQLVLSLENPARRARLLSVGTSILCTARV